MKKLILLFILILLAMACFSQDTIRFKSSRQEWSFYDKDNIKRDSAQFELLAYNIGEKNYVEINSVTDKGNKRKFLVGEQVEKQESGDTILMSYSSSLLQPPFDDCYIRVIFVSKNLDRVGVLTPKVITYYLADIINNDNKLKPKP